MSHTRLPKHDEGETLVKTSSWQGADTPVRHDGARFHPPRQRVIGEKHINRAPCFALDLNAYDEDRLPSSSTCDVFF